eukprot:c18243_g1_i1.p1 GENE.c18243_g1_i1~~c18243_g1_i1.p1  ORF type:complete len:480 (-),score=120.12 c18243_g1_i1:121-1560(-)
MASSSSVNERNEEGHNHGHGHEWFGKTTIGKFGSLCLLTNNVTGPGLVMLGGMYQTSGWVSSSLGILACFLISVLCSLFLCETLARIGERADFNGRVEFASLIKLALPQRLQKFTLIAFLVGLQATNTAGIVQSSQTADDTMLAMFGKTCAFQFYPSPGPLCIEAEDPSADSPFGTAVVISLGFVTVLLATVPLGFLNLDDNTVIQIVAFFGLMFVVLEWTAQFCLKGLNWSLVPAVTRDQSGLFGNLLFNYAFLTTIPSWANEKHPSVNTTSVLLQSTALASLMFLMTGFIGGLAYKFGEEDLLSVLAEDPNSLGLTKACVYAFPLIALVTSIPIFSIVVRYNLVESGMCGPAAASFWAVPAPWLAALVFYSGDMLNNVVNWTGLLVAAPLNFVLPCWLYIRARERSFGGVPPGISEDEGEEDQLLHQSPSVPRPLAHFRALPDHWPAKWIAWVVLVIVVITNVFAIVVEIVSVDNKS